jgi:glutamyl aminopeptidase
MLKQHYKDLFDLEGISGYENKVRQYMETEISKYRNFEIVKDKLGSIFAIKRSKNKDALTLMIAGHMDEVGMMVTGITELGMLQVKPIGGLIGEVFVSQVLNVHTKDGVIKGVMGGIPPHMRKEQNTNLSEMLLDIGAQTKEEAISYGVELGNMVLFDNPFTYTKNKDRLISKAIDNRYGCGLALDVVEAFNDVKLPITLVVGATVQEEVGLRGAETSVQLFNPDLFIALDASPVNDALDKQSLAGLGKGFLVRIFDPRNIIHQGLLKFIVKEAKKKDIRYQYFTSMGGTDAAKALDMLSGIPATTIGLPARYIHSTAAMMDLRDLDSARAILFHMIETIDSLTIQKIKEGYFE